MQQVMTFEVKPKSQNEKILERLRQAGMWGVSNYELNKTCFRYSARIKDLRDKGHIIQTIKGDKPSSFRFVLVKEAS